MHLKLRGGAHSFCDISNEACIQQVQFTKNAPRWRVVQYGINLEGRCDTKTCEAYKNRVYYPLKQDLSNSKLHQDICSCYICRDTKCSGSFVLVVTKARCPECLNEIKPISCGFYNCEWRYEGLKINGEDYFIQGNQYHLKR